jgi:hypothetical protein
MTPRCQPRLVRAPNSAKHSRTGTSATYSPVLPVHLRRLFGISPAKPPSGLQITFGLTGCQNQMDRHPTLSILLKRVSQTSLNGEAYYIIRGGTGLAQLPLMREPIWSDACYMCCDGEQSYHIALDYELHLGLSLNSFRRNSPRDRTRTTRRSVSVGI